MEIEQPKVMEIHCLRWAEDHSAQADEESNTLLHGVLKVDGEWMTYAGDVRVKTGGGQFVTVVVEFVPGEIQIIGHDAGDWPPEGYEDRLGRPYRARY